MRARILLSTILLLAAVSTAVRPPAFAGQYKADLGLKVEEDSDAYAIYSVLLRTERPHVTAWHIRNQTQRGPLPMCVTPPPDQEQIYRSVIDQFTIRNQEKLSLKRSFDLPAYDLVSPQDKVLPVFEVSAVGFNNDHTRALVYVGHGCGGLCGGGTYHLMVKMNGRWQRDPEFGGAPFCLWVA